MFRIAMPVLCCLLSCSAFARAQSERADAPSTPTTVEAAEAEGAVFPREATPATLTPDFQSPLTLGASNRKCVEFPVSTAATSRRSGEFIVGGSTGDLKAGQEGKVWWAPMHDPASRKSMLVVRSARLDQQPVVTSRFTSSNYAFPMGDVRTPLSASAVDYEHAFYPSGFSLPGAGRWLLTVTSGNDWGCFIVTVRP